MPTTYDSTEIDPGPDDGPPIATHAVVGGRAQVITIDIDGDPLSSSNPMPCVVV